VAHIELDENVPGIRSLFTFRPDTARVLCELADLLLHSRGTLTPADRELIATYVSFKNDCFFCQSSHGAIAAHYLGDDDGIVADVERDFEGAEISDKLKALINIAAKVQKSGKEVLPEDIDRARSVGASDMEIHDTVLIAAAFSMYNRYVDGLGTWAPSDRESYRSRAVDIVANGYSAVSKAAYVT
jgi:uncharacterized peroxidase-related enzyme